jgi:hypothetical protein
MKTKRFFYKISNCLRSNILVHISRIAVLATQKRGRSKPREKVAVYCEVLTMAYARTVVTGDTMVLEEDERDGAKKERCHTAPTRWERQNGGVLVLGAFMQSTI